MAAVKSCELSDSGVPTGQPEKRPGPRGAVPPAAGGQCGETALQRAAGRRAGDRGLQGTERGPRELGTGPQHQLMESKLWFHGIGDG